MIGETQALFEPSAPGPGPNRLGGGPQVGWQAVGFLDATPVGRILDRLGANGGVVLRYLITSAINVVNHQLLLQMAVRLWDWSGGQANAFAAMTAVIPAYLLSRYWVWDVQGRPSLRDELVPFWAIAVIGLLASTASAELADRLFENELMISVGSLAGYLLVWVAKFVVLNYLFRRSGQRQVPQVAVAD
jgi:putative flippase GtrA